MWALPYLLYLNHIYDITLHILTHRIFVLAHPHWFSFLEPIKLI